MYYIALDIGGTKTSIALFDTQGNIVQDYVYVVSSKSFQGSEVVYQNIKTSLEHVLNHLEVTSEKILGIGVGAPGPLDAKLGKIIHAPLMGWKNFPIIQRLTEDFKTTARLENDGNLGALAEVTLGVAKGLENIVYMTVSTGCGGGIIINHQIYGGASGTAGEVGHMSIIKDGLECPCGSKGCFELYASGTAINRRIKQSFRDGVKSKAFELAGYLEENIDGKVLAQAALAGDKFAIEMYRQEGEYLGIGIANIFNLIDPQVVVLGGGVTKAKEFFHPQLIETLNEYSVKELPKEPILYSKMNDRVVLYGAYCLIANTKK